DKQPGQAGIIEQVAQVTLLRVILPYMIGKAFLRLGEPSFIDLLSRQVRLQVPDFFRPTLKLLGAKTEVDAVTKPDMVSLDELLRVTSMDKDPARTAARMQDYRKRVGDGVQAALNTQFEKYELTGMTWAKLTRAKGAREGAGGQVVEHVDKSGFGLLHRG